MGLNELKKEAYEKATAELAKLQKDIDVKQNELNALLAEKQQMESYIASLNYQPTTAPKSKGRPVAKPISKKHDEQPAQEPTDAGISVEVSS